MKIFSWIIKDTSIDFLGYRKLAYALSAVLFAASIASVAVRGFNYGIDFSGGVLIEVKSKTGPVDVDKVRSELDNLKLRFWLYYIGTLLIAMLAIVITRFIRRNEFRTGNKRTA